MSAEKMSEDFIKNKSIFVWAKKESFVQFLWWFLQGGYPPVPPKNLPLLQIGLLNRIIMFNRGHNGVVSFRHYE